MAISNVSLNQQMREGEIDAVNQLNSLIDIANTRGTKIYQGNLAKGDSLTDSRLGDYSLFAIYMTNESVPLIAFSKPDFASMRGSGTTINGASTNIWVYAVNFDRNGNTLTLQNVGYKSMISGNITTGTVSEIWGII